MENYDDMSMDELLGSDEPVEHEDHDLRTEGIITKIHLSRKDGKMIQELISDNYDFSYPMYCAKVGIKPPNFYNIVNGVRPCSVDFLNKLLSGIGYQVVVEQKLTLRRVEIGPDVPDVSYILPGDELRCNDEEDLDG